MYAVAGRENHQKFFAAVAADKIVGTDYLHYAARNFPQDRVPGEMTVLVVDFLNVVEIEHKQSGRTVVPAGALQFTLKQVQQRTAIPDSGQDIVGCLKT